LELGNTPEGRGLKLETTEPRSGERLFRHSAAHLPPDTVTTAFSRGYTLPPLRGYESVQTECVQIDCALTIGY
jgi:hypothetical protein